ncbi:hypothetical protein ACWEKT_11755 [Nocardia takedensis]|uniref:hypothetical protein n=1 Tax=Nocardia takedensis TaxID=259390 RepID=UPI000303AC69|nr:hypothetical protein [Nocardia takedensis]
MTGQWDTREAVRDYVATVFDTEREFAIYETRYGWVCRLVLTEEEAASDMGMGLGNHVVDRRTGVVTAHTSLHPLTIGEMYDEAVEAGGPTPGYQVYPPTWDIQVERARETSAEIEYGVRARSLTTPPAEEPGEYRVIIDKTDNVYRTEPETSHVACAYAVQWAEAIGRPSGTWPESASFQV